MAVLRVRHAAESAPAARTSTSFPSGLVHHIIHLFIFTQHSILACVRRAVTLRLRSNACGPGRSGCVFGRALVWGSQGCAASCCNHIVDSRRSSPLLEMMCHIEAASSQVCPAAINSSGIRAIKKHNCEDRSTHPLLGGGQVLLAVRAALLQDVRNVLQKCTGNLDAIKLQLYFVPDISFRLRQPPFSMPEM